MLSSCNLFEPQWDTESLNDPPTYGSHLTPDIITTKPDLFWGHSFYVRGYLHYSGDKLNMARLVPSREMFLAPPPEDNSLWVLSEEGVDLRGCHGKYVEVLGSIKIEELKETGSDRIYAQKPILEANGTLEWFGEVPSAFENPVPNPSEFAAIKGERLALRENVDLMACERNPRLNIGE